MSVKRAGEVLGLVSPAAIDRGRGTFAGDAVALFRRLARVQLVGNPNRATVRNGTPAHSGEWSDAEFRTSVTRWQRLVERIQDVAPSNRVRETAERLLLDYRLRAADSLQLAAAIVSRDSAIAPFDFVTLDRRLAEAAAAEEFRVVP